ncbi:hypothetical protein FOVG_02453 [Fusarium oxysporum f. sp. pisi HDV247]|uniref:Uncharacterized protein n=1 Tax=Fusarium oxysporum f. sp. pisi HDV247 TaxID=1080344 RepID=W9Q3P9_FUSOX|nr:hypothetical protein FOVG_02453 [Fusarium oxysporum f. sp. pisi HDV247]
MHIHTQFYYRISFQMASKDNLSMINQDALSTGCSGMSEMQGMVQKKKAAHLGPMYEDFHFHFHFHFHILCLAGGKRLKVVGLVVSGGGGGGLSVTGLGSWIIRHLSRTWCDF